MAKYRLNGGPWLLPIVTALGVGIMLLVGLNAYSTLNERADEGREERDVLVEDVRVLREQVESLGQIPVAPEPEERIAEDPPPPVSDERIDVAVARFCSLDGCRGPGPTTAQVQTAVRSYLTANPPPPGRPPTEAEINSAVVAFCSARNDCAGPAGEDSTVPGPEGPAGADSTVPGPEGDPGRPPTDEEIAAAVASFCADGACRGADGVDGEDGRGLTGTPEILTRDDGECVLRFHYTAEPPTTDTPLPNRFCRPDLLE